MGPICIYPDSIGFSLLGLLEKNLLVLQAMSLPLAILTASAHTPHRLPIWPRLHGMQPLW